MKYRDMKDNINIFTPPPDDICGPCKDLWESWRNHPGISPYGELTRAQDAANTIVAQRRRIAVTCFIDHQ